MSEATIIYPHQLYATHPALTSLRPVFLVEEPLFMGEFPVHRQKLLLHHLSMTAYAERLRTSGYTVFVVPLTTTKTTAGVFSWLASQQFADLHIVDTTDDWLERRISEACQMHGFTRHNYESPLFFLTKEEAIERYHKSKRHLNRFYEELRQDTGLLIDDDGTPMGSRFSFDKENRQKIPNGVVTPEDPLPYDNDDTRDALAWLKSVPGEHYGETNNWLPYTHETAALWLQSFLTEHLANFGPYEDAIKENQTRLWHSALSPLMNIGLLTPQQIVNATLAHQQKHPVPLASLEGFIRQIVGWREFMRAAYEADGRRMRSRNFWRHKRLLPASFWTGATNIKPIDDSIKKALNYGYTHHIERLMILGNFMLLTETHPDEVYRWFMAMYVDAYDWVMVPNVYGMSQFADGGLFATKPYFSGSNYIRKMSDYKADDWSLLWDALYWHFVDKHKDFFRRNYRLSMMPQLLAKMNPEKRVSLLERAEKYLQALS